MWKFQLKNISRYFTFTRTLNPFIFLWGDHLLVRWNISDQTINEWTPILRNLRNDSCYIFFFRWTIIQTTLRRRESFLKNGQTIINSCSASQQVNCCGYSFLGAPIYDPAFKYILDASIKSSMIFHSVLYNRKFPYY